MTDRDPTKLEGQILRQMSSGTKMTSTNFHTFVGQRRTNRLLLSRLRALGMIEVDDERTSQGTQHWVLSEKGKAWATKNSS